MLRQKTKAKLPTNSAKGAGRTTLKKVGKAQMRLIWLATRSKEDPTSIRIVKYGLAFLVGFIGGTIVERARSERYEGAFVEATAAQHGTSDTSTTDTTSDS